MQEKCYFDRAGAQHGSVLRSVFPGVSRSNLKGVLRLLLPLDYKICYRHKQNARSEPALCAASPRGHPRGRFAMVCLKMEFNFPDDRLDLPGALKVQRCQALETSPCLM